MKTHKWIVMIMTVAVISGCGEGNKKEETPAIPTTTNSIFNQLNGGIGGTVNPFSARQEGMFDGIGQEQLQTQAGQFNQPYPSVRYWHTRIEFLKQDGGNVDPATFSLNMPIFGQRVRITLIADGTQAQAVQYVAEGFVWVYQSKGYALGNLDGNPIRVYNSNSSTPLFDVSFGNGYSTGPMLGILARKGGLYGGIIILTDAAGKHTIQY